MWELFTRSSARPSIRKDPWSSADPSCGMPLGWRGSPAGLLLTAATLRLLPVPVRPLAAAVSLIGGAIFVAEAFEHGGFHLFAFTLLIAGGFLVVTPRGAGEGT